MKTIKCKVCQVETPRRIRCGAFVCEACKRFFIRHQRRQIIGHGLKCKHGIDECLKETQDEAKVTSEKGWLWRGICAACRFKKCFQVGMQYRQKSISTTSTRESPWKSISQYESESFSTVTNADKEEMSPEIQNCSNQLQNPTPTIDYSWLIEFCEQKKREKELEQIKHEQQNAFLSTLLANQYFSQCLNVLTE